MSTTLIINFTIKQEKLQSFKNIMDHVKNNLTKTPGCNSVNIFNEIENPLAFTLVENWQSKAMHTAHVQELIASGQWAELAEHLSAAPQSSYYREI